jgi:hypothetical protein
MENVLISCAEALHLLSISIRATALVTGAVTRLVSSHLAFHNITQWTQDWPQRIRKGHVHPSDRSWHASHLMVLWAASVVIK